MWSKHCSSSQSESLSGSIIKSAGSVKSVCNSMPKSLEFVRNLFMSTGCPNEFEEVVEFKRKIVFGEIIVPKGDIIQYKGDGIFHWAIYMGDCHIAHLTTIGKNTSFSSQSHGIIEMTDLACGGHYRMCRVNNLTQYANKKNYPAKSWEEIMANIYTDLSAFKNNPNYKYHLLFNNCGHMVTFWKYGVPFNPESSIHAFITIPGVLGAFAALVGCAGFGSWFYAIASLPHWAIGVCIGCGIGFGVWAIAFAGIGVGGYYLYRYYKKQNIKYRTQMVSQWRLEEENRLMKHRLNQLEPGYNVNDVMRINYMDIDLD